MEEEIVNKANDSEEIKSEVFEPEQKVNEDQTAEVKKEEVNEEPESEAKAFNIKDNDFEDVQFGNHNTINKITNNFSSDRHGLPTKLNLIEKGEVKFQVNGLSRAYTSKVLSKKILILNCAHEGIRNSLKQSIANQDVFDNYLKYEVSFDNYDGANIQHLVEDCQNKFISKDDEKLLLFIHDSQNDKTPALLNSLRNANGNEKRDLLKKLDESIFIIYITYYENNKFLNDSPFNFSLVNAFDIYATTFHIEKNLIHIIENQQKNHIWGFNESSLLKNLDKIIYEPDFEDLVRNKKKKSEINFSEILKDKNQPVGRYVLFVAVLFPELAPDVFREYVSVLLQNKKVFLENRKVSLLKLWEEDTDEILNDCGLNPYYIDNQYFIGFKASTEKEECEQILFKKLTLFAVHQAKVLIAKQQLFTVNSSFKLHFKMHPVIAKLTGYFKDYYGDELLKEWLLKIESQREETEKLKERFKKVKADRNLIIKKIHEFQVIKNIKDGQDSLKRLKKISPVRLKQQHDELIGELEYIKFLFFKEENLPDNVSITTVLDQLFELESSLYQQLQDINNDHNRANSIVYNNVYLFVNLLTEVYEKGGSKELITKFFSDGFKMIYHHYIILDILTKFQIKNPSFNSIEYYKKAFQYSDKNVNDRTSGVFCELMLQQPSDFYKYQSLTEEWFPDREKPKRDYTKLEKQIQRVYFDVFKALKKADSNALKKNKVLECETYKALFEDESKFDSHISFLIYHLFDIRVKEVGKTESEQKQNQLAELLSYWYYLLRKLDHSDGDPQAKKKRELLTTTIRKELSKKQRNQFLISLKEKRYSYNTRLSKTTLDNDQSIIKNKRDALIEFTNLLKD
jgi:hypothetical protein